MSEYTEFEGKNIEKALENASKSLDLPVEKLQYDILSYGSSGIFGLVGVKKAKIRVDTKNRRSGSRIQNEARTKARDLVKDAFAQEPSAAPETPSGNDSPNADVGEAIAQGQKALQRMVDFICEGATIEVKQHNGRVTFNVDGGNSALLIGKRGQTLEALQYLIEKIVNRQNGVRVRVLVDVGGYLNARKLNLQRLATKMAEKAQKSNKPVTIGQMNAYDRRIVHLHLKDKQGVRTQSVGEGYYRKLVIFPKRRRSKAKVDA